jgi:hypothetical protein
VLIALLASAENAGAELPGDSSDQAAELTEDVGPQGHLLAAVALGRGIRFNNPYRLATPLGDTAESLSLSATYLDLSIGAVLGPPGGIGHGGSLHLASALDGIPQQVLTPSYLALQRFAGGFIVYGRAGVPIVLGPDVNAGFELAGGGAWLFSAGLGATAELVGSVFYGAATHEHSVTIIPIVALQLGVMIDYEILP